MTDMTYLIAQATSAPAGGSTSSPGGGTTAPSGSLGGMLPAMILAMVVFYFLIFRGQKKER
ncbi:MAG: hypothetical protein HZB38_15515, partial [Planctomycetes bacterium]|nr:hypothetical protein [Planctomycetota bacterium]